MENSSTMPICTNITSVQAATDLHSGGRPFRLQWARMGGRSWWRLRLVTTLLGLALVGPVLAQDPQGPASVEAEGRADPAGGNARAEALADALREAVRTGVGVNVVDQSQTTNFQLDFDRVFTSSMGYVRSYVVLSTGIGSDGFYRVRVRAEVAPGTPGDEEKLIFRMLSRARQKPRLMIRIDERVGGQPGGSTAGQWFGRVASELGVVVVDPAAGGADLTAERAKLLGRSQESKLRGAGIISNADYILEGTVTAEAAEPTTLYGTQRRMCSVDLGVKIVDAVTRQVVVSDTMEARRFALEGALSPDIACREAVRRALEESPDDNDARPGMRPIRMLFTHWIAEMDLGSLFRVEVSGLGLDQAETLQTALTNREKIGAVWVRSIDPAGVSVIDVESRLDGMALSKTLIQSLGGDFDLDRSDNRYLSLRSARRAVATPPAESKGGLPILPIASAVGAVTALAWMLWKLLKKNQP